MVGLIISACIIVYLAIGIFTARHIEQVDSDDEAERVMVTFFWPGILLGTIVVWIIALLTVLITRPIVWATKSRRK